MDTKEGTTDEAQMRMEEVEEAEENELLGDTEGEQDNAGAGDDVDVTAEDLMTDMKLEDDVDDIRASAPESSWTYQIEAYPWNADDMTENFVKLIRLAQFSNIVMKKKKQIVKESGDPEKSDDKLCVRQRKGYVQFYTDNVVTAKALMRNITWKSMATKDLTIEIKKRDLSTLETESACLTVDTYSLSKCRFREKPKGELKDRSAKVSNLPGAISREFLDVVFSRAYPVIRGHTEKSCEVNPQQKLQDIEGFNGSIDFDCLARGSCRAFVLSHKKLCVGGQKITIVANDKETMVVPPFTHDLGSKKKVEVVASAPSNLQAGWGNKGNRGARAGGVTHPVTRGSPSVFAGPAMKGLSKDAGPMGGRGRGMVRAVAPLLRPASAVLPRNGPGMPVLMTGRQKMNEKMRRSNTGLLGSGSALFPVPGGGGGGPIPSANYRGGPGFGTVGDSFKQEIASLQNQLECSTKALEAQIAMLQQSGGYFEGQMEGYGDSDWAGAQAGYARDDDSMNNYMGQGGFPMSHGQDFHFNTPVPLQNPRRGRGVHWLTHDDMQPMMGPKGFQKTPKVPDMERMRGWPRGAKRGGRSTRGGVPQCW